MNIFPFPNPTALRFGGGSVPSVVVRGLVGVENDETTPLPPLTWANASEATEIDDVGLGDNTTYILASNAYEIGKASVAAGFWDLGVPCVVTRARRRIGVADQNVYANVFEASNDGVNWVNAYTGTPYSGDIGAGSLTWAPEFDTTSITTTPYRFWRTVVRDVGSGSADPVAAIGDFRLYVDRVLVEQTAGAK